MDQIPLHLLDLIGKKSYESLTQDQRSGVLKYMTPEAYDELHKTLLEVKTMDLPIEPRPLTKQKLLAAFDQTYPAQQQPAGRSVMLYPVQLWKVAAVFLLLAGGALWILQAKSHKEIAYVTIKDTVYVPSFTSNENMLKVYDTVYMVAENGKKKAVRKQVFHRIETQVKNEEETAAFVPSAMAGINLLSVREKDALPNRQKGKSLKDDTLLQQFTFTGL